MGLLHGFFEPENGRPYLNCRLIIPALGLFTQLDLMVDTGAETTVFSPADSRRLSIDYGGLHRRAVSQGTAGRIEDYIERCVLGFVDEASEQVFAYEIELHILPDAPGLEGFPSLLGRDVLDRWRMVYDPPRGELTFEPADADHIVPLL